VVRIRVEPAHLAWMELEGTEPLLFHGPRRRLLKGTPASCRLLDEAAAGRAVRAPAGGETAIAREIARLALAELIEVTVDADAVRP
jgi:hypothetical protein